MEDKDIEDRRDIDRKRFRFDAGINVAHILATITMVIMMFNWGSNVNSAQAVQESKLEALRHDRERDRQEMLNYLAEINRKLDHISEKK